jgi:hypothetical protein
VCRIFREFTAGVGPRTIARTLNEEGVPGPNGKLWKDTTIRGHVRRGTGLVNNELYIGRLIWNRLRYLKDPSTGRRVSRLNPESAWITTEVPELRIVDDKLWQAVRKRQGKIAEKFVNVREAVREHHLRERVWLRDSSVRPEAPHLSDRRFGGDRRKMRYLLAARQRMRIRMCSDKRHCDACARALKDRHSD